MCELRFAGLSRESIASVECVVATHASPTPWKTAVAKQSRQSSRSIAFVVDDEDVIASTLELILLSEGFEARSFVDPHDALQAAETSAPDLLLTDVLMPGMNGIELAIQVTSRCPDCKILLFSGQGATGDLHADAKLKGHDFALLAKPVHPDALLKAIRRLFETHATVG
jgi:DNA-binding NtrC family response regulator